MKKEKRYLIKGRDSPLLSHKTIIIRERKELKMKCIRKLRKAIAMILAIMLIIGVVPAGSLDLKNVKAADTGTAAFANLGNLGTVNIGSKSESGQWHKIKIGNDAVFCIEHGVKVLCGYLDHEKMQNY